MSHYDYEMSKVISSYDYPFYSIIMAAMRQADTDNLSKLQYEFPLIWNELQIRYHAPLGLLEGETSVVEGTKYKMVNGGLEWVK